jgi:hypothetical protein
MEPVVGTGADIGGNNDGLAWKESFIINY